MIRANQHAPATAGTGFRCHSGRSKSLPLEIGVQAIKLSPYRADPPARRPRHLGPATGFWHALVPFTLRIQVSHRTQQTSLRVCPTCGKLG